MKMYNLKLADVKKKWVVVDVDGQPVGRVASQIAYLLRGKHKPSFTSHLDNGDYVIVLNAGKVKLTGNKMSDKVYYRHTNYIGGIKSVVAKDLMESHPERILMAAVKGMLPKNKLGHQMLTNLRVHSSEQHPHLAQKPENALSRTNVIGSSK